MTLMLFAAVMVCVLVIGLIAFFFSNENTLPYEIWNSLMHTLDAGTLAGDAPGNLPHLLLMSLATLFGMFVTSILIGIVATAVENKLQTLRQGTSAVQESGHTVIIGFNDDVYTLLSELIQANANHPSACIVVLGEQDKVEMEEAIASRIPDFQTTQIICRSGRLYENHALELCCVENAASVIVNIFEDAQTIKILLALSSYIREKGAQDPELRYITSVQDPQHIEAMKLSGEGRAEVIYAKDAISRIIAHTCRQHGLSQVLTELFNFTGTELYLEHVPSMAGKTFREACLSFRNAALVGLYRNQQPILKPAADTVVQSTDDLILLEVDDGAYQLSREAQPDGSLIVDLPVPRHSCQNDNLLILGSNDKLPAMLTEYSQYVASGTRVTILDNDLRPEYIPECPNLSITVRTEPITRSLLLELLSQDVTNVLLLNDDSTDNETSDAHTLFRLVLLRDIADHIGHHFGISTELCNADNQRLATKARVDDFVIGSNYINLLLAQVSENFRLRPVFDDLLDEEGVEFYMKPACCYVKTGVEVDGFTLTESALRKGEIYVGYRHMDRGPAKVVVNPNKTEKIVFGEDDFLVVIAED